MKDFKNLKVWQKGIKMVVEIYKLTKNFPQEELYGLTSQMRRSSVSIPSNIAEGFRRRTKIEKLRFLNISQGSLEESRYYLILARDLGYADVSDLWILIEETSKLLEGYSRSIQNSLASDSRLRNSDFI